MTLDEMELLEQHLQSAGAAVHFPPTPDLAGGFWKRLSAEPARTSFRPQIWAGVVAAVIAAVVVTVASVGPARDAAADLVDRINFFETDQSTVGLPTDIPGREVTLEQAETAIGKPILQPSQPEGLVLEKVLLQGYGDVQVAALFFRNDDTAFVLFASNAFVGKGIPREGLATVEEVSGLGDEAFWVRGERIIYSVRPNGALVIGSERVTDANALIWDQDNALYRIEGDLDKDEAVAIAKSLR
jgi:hypothetical protein